MGEAEARGRRRQRGVGEVSLRHCFVCPQEVIKHTEGESVVGAVHHWQLSQPEIRAASESEWKQLRAAVVRYDNNERDSHEDYQ